MMNSSEGVRVARVEGECDDDAARRREEITALVHAHERALYRYLVVMTGNREVALDAVQETFIRAYEHLQRGKSVNTQWLYKVARSRAIDEIRRHRRETSEGDALAAIGVRSEDMTDLNAAFAALSPDDRAVLVMCALEGLSGDEIATRLGIRSGAVRTRLHRARERFRKLYEGES
jgi:RNA polymerase sigma-70 factor (ECF subfamily)